MLLARLLRRRDRRPGATGAALYLCAAVVTLAGVRISNGTTLTAQRTPTARELYGIACAGPATCYAVGDKGTILALG